MQTEHSFKTEPEKLSKTDKKKIIHKNVTLFGKLLLKLYIARAYKNGDSVSFHLNLLNPLSYPTYLLCFIIYFCVGGMNSIEDLNREFFVYNYKKQFGEPTWLT